jgi:predicted metal-binding protein
MPKGVPDTPIQGIRVQRGALKRLPWARETSKTRPRYVGFVKCECPGRTIVPNLGMGMKLSEIKPDKIYLSSCLANAKPDCPYATADEMAAILEEKTGIKVVQGTHDYH